MFENCGTGLPNVGKHPSLLAAVNSSCKFSATSSMAATSLSSRVATPSVFPKFPLKVSYQVYRSCPVKLDQVLAPSRSTSIRLLTCGAMAEGTSRCWADAPVEPCCHGTP